MPGVGEGGPLRHLPQHQADGAHLQGELRRLRLPLTLQQGGAGEHSAQRMTGSFIMSEQVVDDLSYTDYKKDNFDCGHGKFYCEINGEDCDANEDEIEYEINDLQKRKKRSSAGEVVDYFCGATIINDRLASICTETLYFYI